MAPATLQKTFFPELAADKKKPRPHHFNTADLLKLRALAAVAVCQYELALEQDPNCLHKTTADKMIGACLVMQQTMQLTWELMFKDGQSWQACWLNDTELTNYSWKKFGVS